MNVSAYTGGAVKRECFISIVEQSRTSTCTCARVQVHLRQSGRPALLQNLPRDV